MFTLAVVLAVVAALLIALGAALQERSAVRAGLPEGRIAFFLRLLTDPRWATGALLAGCGVALHVVALSNGPVTAIQPVGTVGLLFAVAIKAVLDHHPVERLAVVGCVAVIAGLVALVAVLPHGSGTTRLPAGPALVAGAIGLAVTGAALLLPRRRLGAEVRAGAVALGAGMCYGVAAAVVGVVGRRVGTDVTAVLGWPTLVVVVLLVCGGMAQQVAYRMARFAVVYAVLLVVDPATAGFTGILVLGDPMPRTPLKVTGLALAATVIVVGVVVLSHARAANRTAAREDQACAS